MTLVLKNGTLIDGTGEVVEGATVVVEGSTIATVGKGVPIPEGEKEIIDCSGKTIIPGLMDLHVHLGLNASPDPFQATGDQVAEVHEDPVIMAFWMARNARKTLEAGFTTVREAGSFNDINIPFRKAVGRGLVPGPRIVACSPICMTGGHGHTLGATEADGVEGVRRVARQKLKAGIDVIKVMATGGVGTKGIESISSQFTVEEMKAAIEEAHKAGKRTMTHAQGVEGIRNAILAGVDCIDHGYYLGQDDEVIRMMADRNVYFVPTLVAEYIKVVKEREAQARGTESGIPKYMLRKSEMAIEPHRQSFIKAAQAGVKIAVGTDAGSPFNPHGANAYELELMVQYGFSAMEAIMAATSTAPEVLGLEDKLGTIEAGKLADMVVLNQDPLKDIRILQDADSIALVIKKGEVVAGRA